VLTTLASAGQSTSSLVGVVVGAITGAAGLLTTLLASMRAGRASAGALHGAREANARSRTLEGRLDDLSHSMRESARLVEEVSAELDARAATAKRLQQEAETAEMLAALHRDQAEAVRRMIDAELARTARGIRRDSIVIGFASFVAGAGVTLLITLLVHPLH
jgi:methyl-accepting chemotaxis protein